MIRLVEELDIYHSDSIIKESLQRYRNIEKMEAIWIFSLYLLIYQKDKTLWNGVKLKEIQDGKVISVQEVNSPKELLDSELTKRMENNIEILENLIMSETRILRKFAIFFYGAYHRKFKKAFTKTVHKEVKNV